MRGVGTTLILSSSYPGKAAMAVLAGAVESCEALSDLDLRLPRNLDGLKADLREALDAGLSLIHI